MEAEKVEYAEAEVIESKPLPLVHWTEAGLMFSGFVLGYLVGKAKSRKRKARRSLKKVKSEKNVKSET